jgi:hypothetical protein
MNEYKYKKYKLKYLKQIAGDINLIFTRGKQSIYKILIDEVIDMRAELFKWLENDEEYDEQFYEQFLERIELFIIDKTFTIINENKKRFSIIENKLIFENLQNELLRHIKDKLDLLNLPNFNDDILNSIYEFKLASNIGQKTDCDNLEYQGVIIPQMPTSTHPIPFYIKNPSTNSYLHFEYDMTDDADNENIILHVDNDKSTAALFYTMNEYPILFINKMICFVNNNDTPMSSNLSKAKDNIIGVNLIPNKEVPNTNNEDNSTTFNCFNLKSNLSFLYVDDSSDLQFSDNKDTVLEKFIWIAEN